MGNAATVVVADDEPLARGVVTQLLREQPDFRVVAECRDGRATIERVNALHPDVLFLDIQMPALAGFDVLAELDRPPPVLIFVTAYDEFAAKAFDVAATDYLVKPFSDRRFLETLARARQALAGAAPRYRDRVLVWTGRRAVTLPVDRIDWIEARGIYVRVHAGPNAYLLRRPLATLERELDPRRFVRCHRGALVSLTAVAAVLRPTGAALRLGLRGGATVPVSERRRRLVEARLGR